jgi:hypothetical protein
MAMLAMALLGPLVTQAPASASPNQICVDPTFGGRYYCDYGLRTLRYNGMDLIFFVGTDFAVWVRGRTTTGAFADWMNLEGRIISSFRYEDLQVITCEGTPAVIIVGTDGNLYNRRFLQLGWTQWAQGSPSCTW